MVWGTDHAQNRRKTAPQPHPAKLNRPDRRWPLNVFLWVTTDLVCLRRTGPKSAIRQARCAPAQFIARIRASGRTRYPLAAESTMRNASRSPERGQRSRRSQRENGAGEGARTLDPDRGKVVLY